MTPFLYFSDQNERLAPLVQHGRAEFLRQFPSIQNSDGEFAGGKPQDRTTFERCKLNHGDRKRNGHWVALHKDLLKMRREDPVFAAQRSDWIHGAVLSSEAFVLRFFGASHGDRLLIVNLGRDLHFQSAPEPLLAPPDDAEWNVIWSTEDLRYGGSGTPAITESGSWNICGHSTVVMSGSNLHWKTP